MIDETIFILPDIDYQLFMFKHDILKLDYQIEKINKYYNSIVFEEHDYSDSFELFLLYNKTRLNLFFEDILHRASLIEAAFYFRIIQNHLTPSGVFTTYGDFFTYDFFNAALKRNIKGPAFLTSPRPKNEISSFLWNIMHEDYLDVSDDDLEIKLYQNDITRKSFRYVAQSFSNDQVYDFYKSELDKFNPYHGPDGRFISKPGGTSTSNTEHEPGSKHKPVSELNSIEKRFLKQQLECSDETLSYIRNFTEGLYYVSQCLVERELCGRYVLCPRIDKQACDSKGKTNTERMKKGYSPILKSGDYAHMHHIGQCENSPLAILSRSDHHKKTKLLHPDEWSDINRNNFSKTRSKIYRKLLHEI